MEGNRWVKLWESITKWEWYKDANTARLFFHLIIKAQYKDTRWQGYEIPRGCVVTSRKRLADELGLTERQIRTAVRHLEESKEVENLTEILAKKKKPHFTIYKVVSYDKFQNNDQDEVQEATKMRPRCDQDATTYKKDKKLRNKEIKNIKGFALSDVRFELPLSDGNSYFVVQESLDDWTDMFPSINVLIELKRMKAYLDAHPNKKRKAHEMENFVLRWLSKEQDQKLSFPKQTKTEQTKSDLPDWYQNQKETPLKDETKKELAKRMERLKGKGKKNE